MQALFYAIITIATFILMEFMAWFAHKYVMHGFLWNLHFDHHNGSKGFFEKNDAFFMIFAIPGWLFTMFGMMHGYDWKFYIGLGIILYGIAYFLVHDVLIHRRFDWFNRLDNYYVKVVRKAHRMHHRHLGKHDGESFGMLWVNRKYFSMVDTELPITKK